MSFISIYFGSKGPANRKKKRKSPLAVGFVVHHHLHVLDLFPPLVVDAVVVLKLVVERRLRLVLGVITELTIFLENTAPPSETLELIS